MSDFWEENRALHKRAASFRPQLAAVELHIDKLLGNLEDREMAIKMITGCEKANRADGFCETEPLILQPAAG